MDEELSKEAELVSVLVPDTVEAFAINVFWACAPAQKRNSKRSILAGPG